MFEDSILTRQPATVMRDDLNFVFSGRPSGAAIWYWLHGNNTQGYVPFTTRKKTPFGALILKVAKGILLLGGRDVGDMMTMMMNWW